MRKSFWNLEKTFPGFGFRQGKKNRKTQQLKTRLLHIEPLEQRQLLSMAPTIDSLGVLPSVATRPDNVTLTANNVQAYEGHTVARVDFFVDLDGNGQINLPTDQFLGSDTSSADGWGLTKSSNTIPLGVQTYLAKAYDNIWQSSNIVSATNTIRGISGNATTKEGSPYILQINAAGLDIDQWAIDWGDGPVGNPNVEYVFDVSAASITHIYTDGPNTFTISATATDESSVVYTFNTLNVSVQNITPFLSVSGQKTITKNSQLYTLNLKSSDPGADTIDHWTINWGDNTGNFIVDGNPSMVTHTYPSSASGMYTITASATDDENTYTVGGTSGSMDVTFGSGGGVITNASGTVDIAVQTDGKIVVVGNVSGQFILTRYNSDGSLDTSFDSDGKLATDFDNANNGGDYARSVTVDPYGRIVVVGNSNGYIALARFNSDGSLDTLFDSDGKLVTDITGFGYDVAIDEEGRIVIVGSNGDFVLARYNSDGTPDTSFDVDGKQTTDYGDYDRAASVVIQADGKIVVGGDSGARFALARYDNLGALDTTFGADHTGKVITTFSGYNTSFVPFFTSLAIGSDGKIVAAGCGMPGVNCIYTDFLLARYKTDGALDSSFGCGGKEALNCGGYEIPWSYEEWLAYGGAGYGGATYDDYLQGLHAYGNFLYGMDLQADDKILLIGATGFSGLKTFRLNSNGSTDWGFGNAGAVTVDDGGYYDNALFIKVPSDNLILVGGNGVYNNGKLNMFRYNSDPIKLKIANISIYGPTTVAEEGNYSLYYNCNYPYDVDINIDWGDASDPDGDGIVGQMVTNKSSPYMSHTYTHVNGSCTIKATISDGTNTYTSNSITVIITKPLAPTNLTVQAIDASSLYLTWKNNSVVANEYEIYMSTNGGAFTKYATIVIDSNSSQVCYLTKPGDPTHYQSDPTSCLINGLSSGTQYSFKVRAVNTAGATPSHSDSTATATESTSIVASTTSDTYVYYDEYHFGILCHAVAHNHHTTLTIITTNDEDGSGLRTDLVYDLTTVVVAGIGTYSGLFTSELAPRVPNPSTFSGLASYYAYSLDVINTESITIRTNFIWGDTTTTEMGSRYSFSLLGYAGSGIYQYDAVLTGIITEYGRNYSSSNYNYVTTYTGGSMTSSSGNRTDTGVISAKVSYSVAGNSAEPNTVIFQRGLSYNSDSHIATYLHSTGYWVLDNVVGSASIYGNYSLLTLAINEYHIAKDPLQIGLPALDETDNNFTDTMDGIETTINYEFESYRQNFAYEDQYDQPVRVNTGGSETVSTLKNTCYIGMGSNVWDWHAGHESLSYQEMGGFYEINTNTTKWSGNGFISFESRKLSDQMDQYSYQYGGTYGTGSQSDNGSGVRMLKYNEFNFQDFVNAISNNLVISSKQYTGSYSANANSQYEHWTSNEFVSLTSITVTTAFSAPGININSSSTMLGGVGMGNSTFYQFSPLYGTFITATNHYAFIANGFIVNPSDRPIINQTSGSYYDSSIDYGYTYANVVNYLGFDGQAILVRKGCCALTSQIANRIFFP